MATLTATQRRFIVEHLACYFTPSEVAEKFEDEFGIEITRQQVHHYNPTRSNGTSKPLADRWQRIFEVTRENFLSDRGNIPIAHKNYRLRVLYRQLRAQLDRGDLASPRLILDILQQAAEEEGGKYTNHRKLEHSGEIRGGETHVYLPGNDRDDDLAEQLRRRGEALTGEASDNGAGADG